MKNLSIFLALLCSTFFLSGCSDSSQTKADPFVVGMELAYPPFETKDAQGNPSGVSVDVMKAFAQATGRTLKIENIAFDGLIPALLTGRVNAVMSSMTATSERAKTVAFTTAYANAKLALLVKSDSPIQQTTDLNTAQYTIAAKIGSTGYLFAQKYLPNAKLTALSDESACVMEVTTGRADAFIYDQLTIYRNWQQNQDKSKALFIDVNEVEPWAIAIRQNDTALANELNDFLEQYRANGGFDKLTEKYLAKEKTAFDQLGFLWFFDVLEPEAKSSHP